MSTTDQFFEITLYKSFDTKTHLFPNEPGEGVIFYAIETLGNADSGRLVGYAATAEDFISETKRNSQHPEWGPIKVCNAFFLVEEYGPGPIHHILSQFLNTLTAGPSAYEMDLKMRLIFSHVDFWEYWPAWLDRTYPEITYHHEILGIETESQGLIPWTDLPEEIPVKQPCKLHFKLTFENTSSSFYLEWHPVEEMYQIIRTLKAPTTFRRYQWGVDQITKTYVEAQLDNWHHHFHGSTPDEIILRWTLMAHSDRGLQLLTIPLTPGGPIKFSGTIHDRP